MPACLHRSWREIERWSHISVRADVGPSLSDGEKAQRPLQSRALPRAFSIFTLSALVFVCLLSRHPSGMWSVIGVEPLRCRSGHRSSFHSRGTATDWRSRWMRIVAHPPRFHRTRTGIRTSIGPSFRPCRCGRGAGLWSLPLPRSQHRWDGDCRRCHMPAAGGAGSRGHASPCQNQ